MRQFDINKISAITECIDYVAYQTALKYTKHIIDGMRDPILEDLSYRYEDVFLEVRILFDEELKNERMKEQFKEES